MTVTDNHVKRFKDLILDEAFAEVDPKTVSVDQIKAVMTKGWMFCPSKKKCICFGCGSFLPLDAEEIKKENSCAFCPNTFTV